MAISSPSSSSPVSATGTTGRSASVEASFISRAYHRWDVRQWGELVLGRGYLGLIAGLITAVMLAWGLTRSALWLDEGATVVATQRSWSDLWTLRRGAETPLLPYYVLLKLFCGAARTVAPTLQSHPEILFRLPSVIVTVLASWLLASWMSRSARSHLVVATCAMLLLASGFSRFGQEARPYAAVLFLAVVATVLWSVLVDDPRRRWMVGYALAVTAMVSLHTFSVGLVGAHLVAALVCPVKSQRRPVFWRTTTPGVLGAAVASPLALITARNGTGPLYVYPDVTPHDALTVFVRLFTTDESPLFGVGPILLLALVGLIQVRAGELQFMARLAASWAIVPLVAMIPVLIVHPNLLFERYVLFVLPAWALLAGLGFVTLTDLVRSITVNGHRSAAVMGTAVTVLLIAGVAAFQSSSQREIRSHAGHSEDVRPALAIADRAEYAGLRMVVSSRFGSVLVGAYAQPEEERLVTQKIQRDATEIWPVAVPEKKAKRVLNAEDQVILLQRASANPGCEQAQGPVLVAEIERCMPDLLHDSGFRVRKIESSEGGWVFVLMQR